MSTFILPFHVITKASISITGGKAANLGELAKIPAIQVPPGFCITTEAYKRATENNPVLNTLLEDLAQAAPNNISRLCASIRATIENTPIPVDIATQVASYLTGFGANEAYAIRSSATAEDQLVARRSNCAELPTGPSHAGTSGGSVTESGRSRRAGATGQRCQGAGQCRFT